MRWQDTILGAGSQEKKGHNEISRGWPYYIVDNPLLFCDNKSMLSRTGRILILAVAIIFISSAAFMYYVISSVIPTLQIRVGPYPKAPATVAYAQADNFIEFEAAFTQNGVIHLIWAPRDSQFVYQRSSDLGRSWSHPANLTEDLDYRKTDQRFWAGIRHSRIIASGDTVLIFWPYFGEDETYEYGDYGAVRYNRNGGFYILKSVDGGITWNDKRVPFNCDIIDFSIQLRENVIYLAYYANQYEKNNVYFTRSANFGENWTEPVTIQTDLALETINGAFSMAIVDSTINLLCHSRTDYSHPYPDIYYFEGAKLGEKWNQARPPFIPNKRSRWEGQAPVEFLTLVPHGKSLLLSYREEWIYYMTGDSASAWSSPKRVNEPPPKWVRYAGLPLMLFTFAASKPFMTPYYDICPVDKNSAALFWIDDRYAGMDLAGYLPLPLAAMILWDDDPTWSNNDLFYAKIKDGKIRKRIRLTAPDSYVEHYGKSIACGEIGGKIVVLWAGKRHIEKYLDIPAAPFEIFCKVIDP
jgi:hypothetical protein